MLFPFLIQNITERYFQNFCYRLSICESVAIIKEMIHYKQINMFLSLFFCHRFTESRVNICKVFCLFIFCETESKTILNTYSSES